MIRQIKKHPKWMITMIIFLIAIPVTIGSVHFFSSSNYQIMNDLVGETLSLGGGKSYVLQEEDITLAENITKEPITKEGATYDEIKADLVIDTENFKGIGKVILLKNKYLKNVTFDLAYTPKQGVSDAAVEQDLMNESIKVSETFIIEEAYSNRQLQEMVWEENDLASPMHRGKALVVIEGDGFLIEGEVEVEYLFEEGSWVLQKVDGTNLELNRKGDKAFDFEIETFLTAYEEGKINPIVVGDTQMIPMLNTQNYRFSHIEAVDLDTQKVVLKIHQDNPFYTVGGIGSIFYRFEDGKWMPKKFEIEPKYDFKLEGRYKGWFLADQNKEHEAVLEITQVNDENGTFEGVFSFKNKPLPEDTDQSLYEGSYSVLGQYTINAESEEDVFTMGSGNWIQQTEGFMMKGLKGSALADGMTLAGDIRLGQDHFLLVKEP